MGSRLFPGVPQVCESSLCREFLELCLGSWRSKSEFVTLWMPIPGPHEERPGVVHNGLVDGTYPIDRNSVE